MHIIINMLMKLYRFFCAIFRIIISILFSYHREKVLVIQGSKLNNLIIISQCGSKRIMRFNNLSSGIQSSIDLKKIDYPYLEYIQLMIISLIYYPFNLNNKNILIIGLGGGILTRAIRKLYPNCLITIIEIDPLVVEMAIKYFYFKKDSFMNIYINDGNQFLNNLSNEIFYDIIFVDAYDSINGLPQNMKNEKFFILLKNHLNSNGGQIIFNFVCIYQSYLNIQKIIYSIFGLNNLITFRSNDFLNVVTLASSSSSSIFNINQNTMDQIKQKLSINVDYLLKNKQEQSSHQNSTIEIYSNNLESNQNEQNMSLTQFVYLI